MLPRPILPCTRPDQESSTAHTRSLDRQRLAATALLRQYFPKGKSLAGVTQADLDEVARKLNSQPRQTLGFRTPAGKLTELIDGVPHTDPSER
jgi:hypothetical protein